MIFLLLSLMLLHLPRTPEPQFKPECLCIWIEIENGEQVLHRKDMRLGNQMDYVECAHHDGLMVVDR